MIRVVAYNSPLLYIYVCKILAKTIVKLKNITTFAPHYAKKQLIFLNV